MATDKDTVKTCTNGFKFTSNIVDFNVSKVVEVHFFFFCDWIWRQISGFLNIHIMLDIFA